MKRRFLGLCLAFLVSAAFSACSVVTFSQNKSGALVISEVVSSNKRSLVDDVMGSPDWVELYNGTSAPVNLSGCGLSDNLRDLHKYTFPDVTIEAGGYLIVYATDDSAAGQTNVCCTGFGLSKSGDYLFLTDAYYNLLQQLEVPALITDVSYARTGNGAYGYCAQPTPGQGNAGDVASSLNALFQNQSLTDLSVTEVLPAAAGGYPWVELYNGGNTQLRLENFYLSDTEANPMRWQLPAGTLEPGGYVIVYLSGLDTSEGEFHADFKLGQSDTAIVLSDLTGRRLSTLTWALGIPSGLAVVAEEGDKYTAYPTPGEPNSDARFASLDMTDMDETDPVRISELLRDNDLSVVDADGDRPEWVELHNNTGGELPLYGYFLSDDETDLFKWALPQATIPANGYVIVFLSGKDRAGAELHASFSLGDDEGGIFLTRLDGMRVDRMEAPASLPGDVSVGRDGGGNTRYYAKPTPGGENGYGYETADQIGCFNKNGVFISEVAAAHGVGAAANDWIELYNGGDKTVDLSGWSLSDDPDEPDKFTIEKLSIEPGGYAVVEATTRTIRQKGGVAAFGIPPSGETIVLTDATGGRVDAFSTGVLRAGLTSGRVESDDTVERVFFTNPTKNGKNDADSVRTGYAPEPTFSDARLYHAEAFTVTISARSDGAEIRYTTNGSKPTSRSKKYDGPITVEKTTVLRAVSVFPGLVTSEVATATYLFVEPHTLPVVSLVGDADDIKTVYAVTDREKKIEREAYIQYFESDGRLGTEFPCGVKVKGAGTLVYAQKSLSLHLRAAYGQSSVRYPFYAKYGYPLKEFTTLALRNSGQDSTEARIRNSFFSRAALGMNVDVPMTRPVILYINGVYYGVYDLDEDMNKDFLVNHYGADEDDVDIVRRNATALAGSSDSFLDARSLALNGNTASDETFAKLSDRVDVAYFTDYFIAQTYFANSDMFNQKYWRAPGVSIKWRPICFDQDFLLNSYTRDIMHNFFSERGVPSANGTLTNMDIYVGLRRNKSWRKFCAERYVELIVTQFAPERLTALLDEMAAELRPEMERHIRRWGAPSSMKKWENSVAELRRALEKRPQVALEQVRDFFDLSNDELQALVQKYAA